MLNVLDQAELDQESVNELNVADYKWKDTVLEPILTKFENGLSELKDDDKNAADVIEFSSYVKGKEILKKYKVKIFISNNNYLDLEWV